MKFLINATDVNGNSILLPTPVSMEVYASLDTPSNALVLTLPCLNPTAELTHIDVRVDGKLVFSGIVDEQTAAYCSKGCILKINARSHSALLIDNEAIPATYHTPSLADIFSKHAKSYGIKGFLGDNGVCDCDFTVKKGVSEWEVIENFCRSVLKVNPLITNDGFLDARVNRKSVHYTFSNNRNGDLKFTSAKVKRQRYGTLSQVAYKLATHSDYIYACPNDDAVERKIIRRRLLNLSSNAPEFNEYRIKSTIQKSKADSFEITIEVPNVCITELYSTADFSDALLGEFTGLCIKEYAFIIKPSGVFSRITLCPPENLKVL
ncbi:MAG: hypothetical protein IKU25_03660 [Clostridia bacterium]|nr:hypothetical protein [Clostridia bacterium]